MSTTFTAACVQVNASSDMADNIAQASELSRAARAAGADFITTPENVSMMTFGRKAIYERAAAEADHPALAAFRALAEELGCWYLIGSLSVRLEDDERLANRSYLIDPAGRIAARYDKIHMFDVDLPGGESYRESASFRPGREAVVVPTPWGVLGMTICYDLRFPQLYRALAQAGAGIFTIPAAFTKVTGEAHWQVLQRARAIEHSCFVIAAAQCGSHAGNRKTYGHSLIVAPWGEVLAEADDKPGFITAAIDMGRVGQARAMVPSLTHDRTFELPAAEPAPLRAAG